MNYDRKDACWSCSGSGFVWEVAELEGAAALERVMKPCPYCSGSDN